MALSPASTTPGSKMDHMPISETQRVMVELSHAGWCEVERDVMHHASPFMLVDTTVLMDRKCQDHAMNQEIGYFTSFLGDALST